MDAVFDTWMQYLNIGTKFALLKSDFFTEL